MTKGIPSYNTELSYHDLKKNALKTQVEKYMMYCDKNPKELVSRMKKRNPKKEECVVYHCVDKFSEMVSGGDINLI